MPVAELIPTTKPKRGVGRPPLSAVPGVRGQTSLPPALNKRLRELGNGSLSLGIIVMASKWEKKQ